MLILVLDELHDVDDLLTAKDFVIVHTGDGVEDCPHDLRIVDSSVMVSDIETEDDLVESRLLNSDTLVAQGWRQISQKVWKPECSHKVLTHGIVLGPSVLESLDVLLFECKNIILVLSGLIIVETLTDNSNEHIHEDQECNKLEQQPEENGNDSGLLIALVHNAVP